MYKAYFNSQLGIIEITGNTEGIKSLDFTEFENIPVDDDHLPDCIKECLVQLSQYFEGKRKRFELALIINGTDFQQRVWDRLLNIPYGKTLSYKDIASMSGNIKAVRAVGNANNKNKIAVIIPCHRVIGSNKSLTGYAGGLWRKKWLIDHEKKLCHADYVSI
ncbi:MAG: methylated-DNA--[protein]-cysteine S-methyltransferase [Ignavibacteria bacterium]